MGPVRAVSGTSGFPLPEPPRLSSQGPWSGKQPHFLTVLPLLQTAEEVATLSGGGIHQAQAFVSAHLEALSLRRI